MNWNNFLWPLLFVLEDEVKTLPVGIVAFLPLSGTAAQLEGYDMEMARVGKL